MRKYYIAIQMRTIFLLSAMLVVLASFDGISSDSAGFDSAQNYDINQNYIAMEVLPVCTLDGQVMLVFTNVSPGKLFVKEDLFDHKYFDAGRIMSLYSLGESGKQVHLGQLIPPSDDRDWVVIESGHFVEYIVDFRKHSSEIDVTKSYRVAVNYETSVITENGKSIDVSLASYLIPEVVDIEGSCFK